jgi:TolA-binding protein
MGQSAGISGANKRADLSAQLQSRMAELGMMEQKDNQQAAQQDADNQRQAASMNADSENRRYSQALQMAQMMMSEQQWNTTRGDNLEQGAAELAQRQMQSQAELVEQQRRDTAQAMESTGPNADSIQSIIDLLAKSNIKPGDDKFAQTFSAYQRTR